MTHRILVAGESKHITDRYSAAASSAAPTYQCSDVEHESRVGDDRSDPSAHRSEFESDTRRYEAATGRSHSR